VREPGLGRDRRPARPGAVRLRTRPPADPRRGGRAGPAQGPALRQGHDRRPQDRARPRARRRRPRLAQPPHLRREAPADRRGGRRAGAPGGATAERGAPGGRGAGALGPRRDL
ncbi:MAG: Twin-arginine translocation protein TatB, partial [uncultured Frankineae bacterium]